MFPLREAASPGEYAQLRLAIKAYCNRVRSDLGADFNRIKASRVKLGALGEEFVVYFAHSSEFTTGGDPMALLVRGPKGYRVAIMTAGYGYALLPSGGPVPEIAFYFNDGGGNTQTSLFHYAQGRFVTAGNQLCNPTSHSGPVGAHAKAKAYGTMLMVGMPASPAEYEALRPVVKANLDKQSPTLSTQLHLKDAHALNLGGSNLSLVTAVALCRPGANRNCSISIYAHHYQGGCCMYGGGRYWPISGVVSGWGVARSPFLGPAGNETAFVIARHLSPNQDELTRYAVALTVIASTLELTPSSRLLPDACEIVTSKTGHWPARWDPAALVAQPVSCAQNPSRSTSQTPATERTNVAPALHAGFR